MAGLTMTPFLPIRLPEEKFNGYPRCYEESRERIAGYNTAIHCGFLRRWNHDNVKSSVLDCTACGSLQNCSPRRSKSPQAPPMSSTIAALRDARNRINSSPAARIYTFRAVLLSTIISVVVPSFWVYEVVIPVLFNDAHPLLLPIVCICLPTIFHHISMYV
jgi:hypothetical protein